VNIPQGYRPPPRNASVVRTKSGRAARKIASWPPFGGLKKIGARIGLPGLVASAKLGEEFVPPSWR
jgi:hypothetical protein